MQQQGNLYFVSDAHLGSGADSRQREVELCQWIDSIAPDCQVLMMLGDMFDFWFSYKHVVPRGHVRLLGKVAQLCDSGVEVHFFTGNHDMWMFDYLTTECGVQLHTDPITYTFDGRTFLVGHGDGLGHLDRLFDFWRHIFRSRFNQRLFALLPPGLTFPLAQWWSDSNKRKHERHDMLHYLGDEREGIVLHCREQMKQQQLDYCVFGHRHTPLVRTLDEATTYVNVGDWLKNRNYAVYDPQTHALTLHDYGRAMPCTSSLTDA